MQQLFVLFHSPGPGWDHAAQASWSSRGITEHVAFMRRMTGRGLMVLGGPFGDDDAAVAVGMAIVTARDAARPSAWRTRIGRSRTG